MSLSPPGPQHVSLKVPGNDHASPRRYRLDLLYEQLGLPETLILGDAVGQGLLVPVGREDEAGPAQGAQQAARVVVDLESLARGGDQRDVRAEPLDLALDVVHRAKPENAVTRQADQIRERPTLGVD